MFRVSHRLASNLLALHSSLIRLLVLLPVLACSAAAYAQTFVEDAALPDAPAPSYVSSANSQQQAPQGSLGSQEDAGTRQPLTLKKAPLRILDDELHIFTSPARIRTGDLKWMVPLAAATAASLSTDTYTMRNVVSRSTSFNSANATASDALRGAAIGVPVLMLGIGAITKDERARESGLLAGEAMVDAYAFDEVVKYATLRERPAQDNARGNFYVGAAASDPSFISGHSIVAWSSAAVLASEYNRPWQQIGIYTLASGVSLTRVLAQQHFPTDSLLGSAAGWLIGRYVYRAHHRLHR